LYGEVIRSGLSLIATGRDTDDEGVTA
jgi:hypothetical protein